MLDDVLTDDRIQFAQRTTWREAVTLAAAPLLADGSVRAEYVEQILENIAAPGGTYMDLGFGIALAHARPEAGVDATALALLVLEEPVALADDPAHQDSLVFVLAATDGEAHRGLMAQLATLLIDAEARTRLTRARSHAEVRAAIAPAR
ncbi:PTS sugar transporter subunit IIA [Brachybacterium hainanense]|uniref:Ascorbate-specific PTS system EIIA component n=1 Tax=Brachybacterium hainanense TaxID=1541174 RepID=A0ABV6RA58_9MICO